MSNVIQKEIDFAGRKLSLETGHLANQATGSVMARFGDTVVLATVVMAEPREDIDWFPLTVEYEERLYAGGKIKTSRFVKREGRPRDEATLNARLIDRAIRPLFPADFKNEIQVIITVLSVDQDNDPAVLSLVATSAALSISGIPWEGPVAAVRIGYKDGSHLLNPVNGEMEHSELDLVVAGKGEGIVMVEASANEVSEEVIVSAFEFAQEQIKSLIDLISEFTTVAGKEKIEYEGVKLDQELNQEMVSYIEKEFPEDIFTSTKQQRQIVRERFLETLFSVFEGKAQKSEMEKVFDEVVKKVVRKKILQDRVRPDGRSGMDEIRPLEIKVGLLPRTHGSAVFQRGETQALTIATLGSTSLEQLIEGMTGEETKRFIHHYNFPPFSVGEVRRRGWPSRREVGHGALAERALLPLIPDEERFPYTIRLVSEILSSAGSTSMASVCGISLALMDAGVPISRPVAGIAMGLVQKGDDAAILSDIAALEDYFGDMDLKVAGTEKGITAMQMDIKTSGLTHEILQEVLQQAREGRLFILTKMKAVIDRPREKISEFAPRITVVEINPKKIGEIIGPGGKIIRSLQEETDTVIDIKEDGRVFISGLDEEKAALAKTRIENITREVKVGEIFEGKVTRLEDFGAFVEVLPGKGGLCHISELAPGYVKNVRDYVDVGDTLKVKVVEIDDRGRINLSHRVLGAKPAQEGGDYRRSDRVSSQDGYPGRRTTRRTGAPRGRSGQRGRGGRQGPVSYRTPHHQRPGYKGSK